MCSTNRRAHELREQTATQNSKLPCKINPLKNIVTNTWLMMWALFNSLKRRYLPSNPQNNWLYAAAATKKNASQQNHFARHQRSVTVSDDVSWQSKISLHEFDNCISQVKIDATAACFLLYLRSLASSSFSRTVPRCTKHVRQSAFLPVS